jgi:RimJ/RimL family protein N-acetyltransferase
MLAQRRRLRSAAVQICHVASRRQRCPVCAMVRHGFETLGLRRIYSLCHSAHRASGGVLEKAGLAQESLLRNCSTLKNKQWDMQLYSRTLAGWRAQGD